MAVDPSTSTGDGDGDGSPSAAAAREIEYRFYCEFQSHDPEFDYLKSLEIEERINKIRWCRARTGPLFLLSTNDKTIKLWKVHEKSGRVVTSRNVDPSQPAAAQRAPFLSASLPFPPHRCASRLVRILRFLHRCLSPRAHPPPLPPRR